MLASVGHLTDAGGLGSGHVELKEGAVIADRFRLVRLLGKGGMGEVWAAQHASLDIPCAVKFIHAESAEKPEVRMRFEREAKAAAQLRSPNVVQILDYGVFESTPYIAMEYLDGEPLNARLQRRTRLDAHETYRIVSGVGKALIKAHAAGIVHRDLKPENIFLVRDDEGETPKVLDFGVAKSTTTLDSNTRTGALLGTPYFMSPEQAQGTKAVDSRADLWSLAVVTYRCITGELPFKSQALGDLLIKIVTHPIPIPSHVASGVPEGFDGWWLKAAERDPDRRFQTAREMISALGMALGVSMPSTLGGGTPMPGTMNQELARGFGAVPQTVMTDPGAVQAAALPHAPPQPSRPAMPRTQPLPQYQLPTTAAVQSGSTQLAQAPYPHGAPPQPPVQQPGPGLGDSHGSASVAGVYAPAPQATGQRGPKRLAIALGVLIAGGVATAGAVLLFRNAPAGTGPSTAESSSVTETTTVERSGDDDSASGGSAAASAGAGGDSGAQDGAGGQAAEVLEVDGGAPAGSAEPPPSGPPAAHTARPPGTGAPPPTGTPKGLPTSLDLPTTPPPAKTYDPGF